MSSVDDHLPEGCMRRNEEGIVFWIIVIIVAFLLVMMILGAGVVSGLVLVPPVRAQDAGWVDQLSSERGVCCVNSDGRRLDGVEWRSLPPGHDHAHEVEFAEGWVPIPPAAEVKERNKDGIARVWSTTDAITKQRTVRCFLPGSES